MIACKSITGTECKYSLDGSILDDNEFETIGEGVFGMIYESKATATTLTRNEAEVSDKAVVPVIVKKLMEDVPESTALDFNLEVTAMERLDHPNVLRLLGRIAGPPTFGDFCALRARYATFFRLHKAFDCHCRSLISAVACAGSLKSFLQSSKAGGLSDLEQLRMARDLAAGMKYLMANDIVHG